MHKNIREGRRIDYCIKQSKTSPLMKSRTVFKTFHKKKIIWDKKITAFTNCTILNNKKKKLANL